MAYSQKVLDHYENPRNVGSFDKSDPNVGTGMVGAPACGDVMKLQIKVDNDVITDAKFKTYGCGSAIAASSLVTEMLIGKTLKEAEHIKNTDIVEELALPPVKIHCSVLAEDAIKAAIKDLQLTQEKEMKENQERKAKMVDGYAQPQLVPVPNFAGYPEKNVKTTGVETRGNGAATKGTKARGPLV